MEKRQDEDSGGGERHQGLRSGVQGRGQWYSQAGGSGADMDEKEAPCQGLVIDWEGVGTRGLQAKSQGLGLSS